MDIGVDFHGRVHKPMAKVLAKALEPFHPMFWKKSFYLKMKNTLKVADSVAVPLATGERLYTRWQFKNLFKQGTVDIIQPDVALCGESWKPVKSQRWRKLTTWLLRLMRHMVLLH